MRTRITFVLLLLASSVLAANYPLQFKSKVKLSVGTTISTSSYEVASNEEIDEAGKALEEAVAEQVPNQEYAEEINAKNRKLLESLKIEPEAVLGSVAVAREGNVYYDYLNKKARVDVADVNVEVSVGGFNHKRKWMGSGGILLRYDQGKNFTWGVWPHNKTRFCHVQQMNATMLPLFVPSVASKTGSQSYSSPDGQSHNVDVYTVSLPRGAADMVAAKTGVTVDFSLTYYADTTPLVYYVSAKTDVGIGKWANVALEVKWEVYQYVIGQPIMAVFEPSTKNCTMGAPPRPLTVASLPVNAPVCPVTPAPSGCVCSTATAMPFCGAYVAKYPLDKAIDPTVWDSHAKNLYIALSKVYKYSGGATIPSACQTKIKAFYCRYTMPRCVAGGILYFPEFKHSDFADCGQVLLDVILGHARNSDGTIPNTGPSTSRRLLAGSDPNLVSSTNSDNEAASSPFQAYRSPYDQQGVTAGGVVGILFAVAFVAAGVAGVAYWKKTGKNPIKTIRNKFHKTQTGKEMTSPTEDTSTPYVEYSTGPQRV